MFNWISDRYGDADLPLDFHAVNIAENVDLVREYAEQLGLDMPIILGSNALFNQYRLRGGVSPYPVDYVLDGERIVQYANHEYEPELILIVIDRLLDVNPGDVGVEPPNHPAPWTILLRPAFPNPFNGMVGFEIFAPFAQPATVAIYDVRGRRIETLFDGRLPPGLTRLNWSPKEAPAGIYVIRATGGSGTAGMKTLYLK